MGVGERRRKRGGDISRGWIAAPAGSVAARNRITAGVFGAYPVGEHDARCEAQACGDTTRE
jgi:hypothetical protein